MITFTKEQLIASAHARIEFAEMMLAGELEPLKERTWSIELELARIALASLEAEAVAYTDAEELRFHHATSDMWPAPLGHGMDLPLNASPPAPVCVPDEPAVELLATDLMKRIDKITGERHSVATLSSLRVSIVEACRAAMLQGADGKPELTVWYGAMPETNGKTNWTAMLHRKCHHPWEGITIDRSEYPDRVRYEADRMRHLIGELADEPDILAYDAEAHSGYVYPGNSPVIQDGWVAVPVDMAPEQMRAVQLNSELGGYAAANLTGAYSLFREFWDVAIAAGGKVVKF